MAFTDIQEELKNARDTLSAAQLELFKTQEKFSKTRREMDRLGRFVAGRQGSTAERLKVLQERETVLAQELKRQSTAVEAGQRLELEKLKDFFPFMDPRENISKLDDRYPILLFPLRIETRFKQVEGDGQTHNELWVRVYPDEIAMDTFEPLLSENEVRNARSYWTSIWTSREIEDNERAAWRSLVGSHGSGRAYWITQNYRPVNEAQRPTGATDRDVILVIATDEPPAGSERTAIEDFWREVWLAQENREQLDAAVRALSASVGQPRADEIQTDHVPANLSEPPPADIPIDDLNVQVVFLELPHSDDVDTKLQSWSQTARTHILPEKLVLLGFTGSDVAIEAISNPIPGSLALSPDPSAGEADQIRIEDGEIVVNEEMKWMVDFDEALAKGMGFRIRLSAAQAQQGFDRLFVLGVRVGTDKDHGKATLETLFEHHQVSRKGISILPQGTPTNNTEKEGAGYSWREDSDRSFDLYFKSETPPDPAEWTSKKDGRWLAEALGIDREKLQNFEYYYHTDQCEARALNTAIWPATLGYFMETMMAPVFSKQVIEQTRSFCNNFVSGRGMIPAIRVGKQPYGILPATTYSRMNWLLPDISRPDIPGGVRPSAAKEGSYLLKLYQILRKIDSDWESLLDKVAYVGKDGDAHQLLLDIVGLHPTSVEFYSRNAESFAHIYNNLNLMGWGALIAALLTGAYVQSGMDLLAEHGYTPPAEGEETGIPDILQKFFFGRADLLTGPMIDDVPLSEEKVIRAYTVEEKNYIQWLIDATNTSHDTLRKQLGFIDNKPPAALLYLMLHHALDLGYLDSSLKLHVTAEVYSPQQSLAARQEPQFIHVQEEADVGSRWQHLYKTEPRITGQDNLQIGDYIPQVFGEVPETQHLREQIDALQHLVDTPTARLERAFVEHLDMCSYRLDSWTQGLVHYQLAVMRNILSGSDDSSPAQGIYLGAYGWLEEVRPENKEFMPVTLDHDLEDIFSDPDKPLMSDKTNAGYIHAPSLNHAITAAVLRNGYLENATPVNPGSLAVNLSSERVRLALTIIEGIQGGQSLATLLGYHLERGLHDRQDVEVDEIIFDLRKAFPLSANRLSTTQTDDFDTIDQIEAKNVVDGLALIEQIKDSGDEAYPFGNSDLPALSDPQKNAVDEEVQRILNINDAVADLAIAESVHQVVQGNYDRAAATLDTYSKGQFPPIPDVIQTPRSGITLTHRVGLQLESGLAADDAANTTPRSQAEPALNKWLGAILPAMDDLACQVEYQDSSGGTQTPTITLQDLELLPIDALYLVNMDNDQAMTHLDDLICLHVMANPDFAPEARVQIHYTQPVETKFTLFEAAPLVDSLRSLVQRSRPLAAGDLMLSTEAAKKDEIDVSLDPNRIVLLRDALEPIANTELANFIAAAGPLVDAEDIPAILPNIDAWIDSSVATLKQVGRFGLAQTGFGFLLEWKRAQFERLFNKIRDLITAWEGRLSQFEDLVAGDDEAMDDETRFALLQKAERMIAVNTTTPRPDTPGDLKNTLLNTLKPAFEQQLSDIRDLLSLKTLSGLYAGIGGQRAGIAQIDRVGIDIENERKQVLILAQDLRSGAEKLQADLLERIGKVDDLLSQHDAAVSGAQRVRFLLEAGKLLLGEDFKIIPEFTLSEVQADEWQNTYNARNALLRHQTDTVGEEFPVDSWLYGMARVREKMGHLERATLMLDALKSPELKLEPVQLPFKEEDYWLALEYPEKTSSGDDFVIDQDKLLYTAHFAVPFDKTKKQCGLLLDEWTEVIPTVDETTGLSFHYDRPNSEPPQTLLLATPSDFRGAWQWQDLVDTLHETLDMAKKRAIEPTHIDTTAYARFLPALVSAVTTFALTPALNLALNNQFYTLESSGDE